MVTHVTGMPLELRAPPRTTVRCPHCKTLISASNNATRGTCPRCRGMINLISPPKVPAAAPFTLDAALAPLTPTRPTSRHRRPSNVFSRPWLLPLAVFLISLLVGVAVVLLFLPNPSAPANTARDLASTTQPNLALPGHTERNPSGVYSPSSSSTAQRSTLKPFGPLEWDDSLAEVLEKIQTIDGLEEINFSRLYDNNGNQIHRRKFSPPVPVTQELLRSICGVETQSSFHNYEVWSVPRSDRRARVLKDYPLFVSAYPVVIHGGVFRLSVRFSSDRSMAFCEPERCLRQAQEVYPAADYYFPLAISQVCLTLVEQTSSSGLSPERAKSIIDLVTTELDQKYPSIRPERVVFESTPEIRFRNLNPIPLDIVTWSDAQHRITTGAEVHFPESAKVGITNPTPTVFYENLDCVTWSKRLGDYYANKRNQEQRTKFASANDHKGQL